MIFIFLVIFSLPLYLIRFSIFGLKTNILDVFLILTIVYSFFFFRFSLFADAKIKKLLLPVLLILIGAIVAAINSENILRSLGILKSYFVLPILFFFTASAIIKTQEQKEKILKALFLSGFIVALIGIFYWTAGELAYEERLRTFFESPNQLAMFLTPAFIIGSYFIFFSRVVIPADAGTHARMSSPRMRGPRLKLVWIPVFAGMTAIIGIALFFTKSLGAMSTTFISLICFLVFHNYPDNCEKQESVLHLSAHMRTKIIKNILFFITSILIITANLYLFYFKDFSERSSLASRITIWQPAGAILKDNWILGIGPGTFQEKYLEYQKYFPPYLEWTSPQPHNIFLAFWLQTGIIGFVGFLWLIFIFFKNVWQNKKDDIVFLGGILMIYTLAHGLIDTTYWKNDLAIMFWAIILLSQNLGLIESSARQD